MKNGIIYFLLFIFTIQCTKSLWIITSFEINREYIASNLCINRFDKIPTCKGQCFVNNELSKDQKNNKKELSTTEKNTVFVAPNFIEIQTFVSTKNYLKKEFSFIKEAKYTFYVFAIENPPELV